MNKITSINGTLIASLNELNEHVENGTAHVTEEERTAWNNQTTVKAKGILIATQEDLDEHTGNKAIHVTEDERAAWNAKADAAALSAKADASSFNVHKDDAVVHITAKERETWNGKQDKLTDEAGNMTLDGGLTAQGGTFSDAVNANGGINIPLAAGPRLILRPSTGYMLPGLPPWPRHTTCRFTLMPRLLPPPIMLP